MKDKNKGILNSSMSRRKFIKASAVATAATGAVLSNPVGSAMKTLSVDTAEAATKASEEKVFAGACRANCFQGCFLNIHVRDGKVVRTSMREMPDPEYNRICVKGLTHVQRIYNKDRLKYPMKRVGERGEGKWERITWDEAITTITDKWKEYANKYGKSSFGIMWGSGNYAALNGAGFGSMTNRLLNATGASQVSSTVDMALGIGKANAIGGGTMGTNEPADLKNAKTIIIWGSNPVNSQIQCMHFIEEAKELGATLIGIDPIYNASMSKVDEFVPIRPGTDGALALGMMNIIVRENWIDQPFLKKASVAPFLVKENDGTYLRMSDLGVQGEDAKKQILVWDSENGTYGPSSTVINPALEGSFEINGIKVHTAYSLLLNRIKEYPPEKASEITDVPVEQIEKITKIYATNKPSSIYTGFGLDHYKNGWFSTFSVMALAIITGNVGCSGSLVGYALTYGTSFINLGITNPLPDVKKGPNISVLKLGQVVEENMYGNKPQILKGLFLNTINTIGNGIDRKKNIEAFKKVEFLAVADMSMTETAKYADILLPVAHWFEVNDIFANYHSHPNVILQEKAIEPLYECLPDFEILKMIAEKLGLKEHFNMTDLEYIDMWLDSKGARGMGITLENMQKEKIMRFLPRNSDDGKHFIVGKDGAFQTTTGRAQFYQEKPTPYLSWGEEFEVDKYRLPGWEPPYEAWHENEAYNKYPLSVIQDHTKWRTHSQWFDVPVLREFDPEPTVKINSKDAKTRKIKNNDTVKVYNDRGYVVMKAVINEGVRPGVITMPKGWEKGQFIDGHYQDLGSMETDIYCPNSIFFDQLVEVEKM